MAGRQVVQRAIEKRQLLPGLLETGGEFGAVPGMPGVAGFDRFAIGVEQAEVEIEAVSPVPAERAR